MFGKLFGSMFDGSLHGNWKAIVTLQQMVILADMNGTLEMTPIALAARTSIPLEVIQEGIDLLEQPDQYSRSDAEEGRRIVRLDETRPWGWRIVNYKYYRDLASAEEKRAADRARIAEKRRRVAECRGESQNVAKVAHAEAEAEAIEQEAAKSRGGTDVQRIFDHWRSEWKHPRAQLDDKRKRLIKAALKLYTADQLCLAISGYLKSSYHTGKNERGTVYSDIELFLRDAKHIDAGLKFSEHREQQKWQ